ncbi:hypothetical protein [Nitrosomonas sp. Is37]|nr:hypothetical protein [Nitrosomonas sp. Is37]MDV6345559.1 hypothetical protein [Nitrosomonas sp. Is37]
MKLWTPGNSAYLITDFGDYKRMLAWLIRSSASDFLQGAPSPGVWSEL